MNNLPQDILPLPLTQTSILVVLAEQPRYGYDIMKRIESDSDGSFSPVSAGVYAALARLIGSGMIEDAGEGNSSGSPYKRKMYKLSSTGRQALELELERQQLMVQLGRLRLRQK